MIRTLMFVPVRDNDGRLFGRALWRELETRLYQFGGFTRLPDVSGAWQAEGHTFRDRSRQYLVVLPSWGDLAAWLAVVEWARRTFAQRALYIEVAGIPEIWQPPSRQ